MSDDLFVGEPSAPNKYRLGNLAGRGAEAEVFEGWLSIEGEEVKVAVKMLDETRPAALEERRRAWEQQVELLRCIFHPSIVSVREVFVGAPPHPRHGPSRDGQRLYLIMSWAEGDPLSVW